MGSAERVIVGLNGTLVAGPTGAVGHAQTPARGTAGCRRLPRPGSYGGQRLAVLAAEKGWEKGSKPLSSTWERNRALNGFDPFSMRADPDLESTVGAGVLADMAAGRRHALESFTAPYRERLPIRHEVLTGTGFLEIIRLVLRGRHDLLVKPAENPSYTARLFGSDDMHLLRKCPCPVWLTKPAETANYRRILAAVDVDPDRADPVERDLNARILELSSSLALSDFAALDLVHAWEAPGEMAVRTWSDDPDGAVTRYVEGVRARHERALSRLGEQLRDDIGGEAFDYLRPELHLRRGVASTVIPEVARTLGADLVVMGTVGRTGIAGLLIGNTAETVLEQLQCAVLAIKPPGFETPVTPVP
jgi:universal stress protein E